MRMSECRENALSLDDFAGFVTNGWTKLDFLVCASSLKLARLENQSPLPVEKTSKQIAVTDHIDEESGRSKKSTKSMSSRDCLAPNTMTFKKPRSKARSRRPISAINLRLGLEGDGLLRPEGGGHIGQEGGGPTNALDLSLGPEGGVPNNLKDKIERMDGTRNLLVCERELTASDVNENQHRLLMPETTIRSSFLREDELQLLKNQVGPRKKEIRVEVVEPTLETCQLSLRRWKMGRAEYYVLAGGWKEFVKRNGLKKRDRVQVWSFRVGSELHLAVVVARN